jgi:hypothetical protein
MSNVDYGCERDGSPALGVVGDAPGAECSRSAIEQTDNLGHALDEFPQRVEHWCASEPQGRLIERYCRADIGIAWRRSEPRARRKSIQNGLLIFVSKNGLNAPAPSRHPRPLDREVDLDKPLMLTKNIELMEGPQNVISSLVRIERFDRGSLPLGKPLFAFDTCQWIDEIVEGSVNWKMRVGTRMYAVACGQSRRKQIKSAPSRIDDGSHLGANNGINRALLAGYQNLVAGIRIILHDEFIWAAPLPGRESLLEDWDLGYGPIDASLSV